MTPFSLRFMRVFLTFLANLSSPRCSSRNLETKGKQSLSGWSSLAIGSSTPFLNFSSVSNLSSSSLPCLACLSCSSPCLSTFLARAANSSLAAPTSIRFTLFASSSTLLLVSSTFLPILASTPRRNFMLFCSLSSSLFFLSSFSFRISCLKPSKLLSIAFAVLSGIPLTCLR